MGSLPSRRRNRAASNPPAEPRTSSSGQKGPDVCTAVALCPFPTGAEAALAVGEPLTILSDHGDWWDVVSAVTGKAYHIPSSHVARVSNRWLYEGLGREKAEELLLLPCNHGGSFLVRESQTRKGGYSLSVRQTHATAWDSVRHYRIWRLDNGWLYIAPRITFPSLQALVDYYSEAGEELQCPLSEPCAPLPGPLPTQRSLMEPLPPPPPPQPLTLDWKQLDSHHLLSDGGSPGEASPISAGLREAVTSYLTLTHPLAPDALLTDDTPLTHGTTLPARGPPRDKDTCRTT
ncbi:src-like-adapter 2 [Tachyglossus aculeatus]|uniref:src-like-adapter 2 n=1 Tax=Tachyglossus aculeatus TaxID=9261 RepID=UPI0018F6C26B|nr:src-like-adapter 2 [Tachyglossus aculeatus]